MHIAIEASTWVNPRGYGRFTRELIRALLRVNPGHRITLVLDSGAALAPDLPSAPQVVVRTSRAVHDAAAAGTSRSIADVFKMSRALSNRSFDVVVFPTSYSFVPVARGPFVVVTVHDALPEMLPGLVLGSRTAQLLWSLKSRLACWRANLVATVSQASKRAILEYLPVGRTPIAVLTEGYDGRFTTAPTADDERLVGSYVPPGCRYLLFVGGLSPHKRVPDLVQAFGALAERPAFMDLRLVLAGPGDLDRFAADHAAFGSALRALGPAVARVVQTGFVSDEALAALYRGTACLVLPSAGEGFGLPALEAMASGAPVVAAATPALEELCGDAAEYFATSDLLAGAIERVLVDRARRDEMTRLGPVRAQSFSWDEGARRLLDALPRAGVPASPSADRC